VGAPLAFKHLRNIKIPQTAFSPDKILTNEAELFLLRRCELPEATTETLIAGRLTQICE
jgi:hypothetical protein